MIVCKTFEELPGLGVPLHLALGVFDGVHAGHQEVIRRAVVAATSQGGLAGVLTFEPHPFRVIAPSKAPAALLETLGHKARVVAELGVGLFIPLHFDLALAQMEAGEFITRLTAAPVRTIAAGEDWRFGHNRGGDVNFLTEQASLRGFHLDAVPPVMHDGERISSTRIRQAIRDGNLTAAEQMLRRPYTVTGTVIEGRKLGRTIGFPTANLAIGAVQLPPDGVWSVRVGVDGGELPGVANLGLRPTIGDGHRLLEIHLFDFAGDLYGKELEVRFCDHLRAEKKFPSMEELRQQIAQDAAKARKSFTENP